MHCYPAWAPPRIKGRLKTVGVDPPVADAMDLVMGHKTMVWVLLLASCGAAEDDERWDLGAEAELRGAGGPCNTVADCDDGNPCTEATQCIEQHCIYAPIGGSCDDGSGCTLDDMCIA